MDLILYLVFFFQDCNNILLGNIEGYKESDKKKLDKDSEFTNVKAILDHLRKLNTSIEEDSSINVTRSEKIKIFKMKVDFISIIEACYELIINKNDKLIKHQSKLFKNAFLDVYR